MFFFTACDANESSRYPDKFRPLKDDDKYEKKYLFKDCALKVALEWKNNNLSDRFRVIRKIQEEIKKGPGISFDFPLFGNGTQRPFDSYLFYYANYCEDKEAVTEEIVENYLKDIKGFPPYKIEKIELKDYKNAIPSDWWIDQ